MVYQVHDKSRAYGAVQPWFVLAMELDDAAVALAACVTLLFGRGGGVLIDCFRRELLGCGYCGYGSARQVRW